MKIIWSTDRFDHAGYMRVPSISQLTPLLNQSVEALIYHKSDDSIEDISSIFLNAKVSNLYYINDAPSADISAIVIGKGGKVVDDEFYLKNPELISTITSNSAGSELALMEDIGDMSVLKGFQERIKAGDTSYPKKYMELVLRSAGQLSVDIQEATEKQRQIAEAGVRVLQKVGRQLDTLREARKDEKKLLLDKIDDLKSNIIVPQSKGLSTQNVFMFPEQKYTKTTKGIVVKEIGNVPYLTSFMLGVLDYASRKLHKRAHLTVILPQGENYERMYSEDISGGRAFVNYQNENQRINYTRNITVAFTNYPTVSVMNKLVTNDRNLNIILDRRNSSPKPFYLGSERFPLSTFYAVQSEGMFEAFKASGNTMKRSNSFSSIQELDGTMFTIPMFESYSNHSQQRMAIYSQECSEFYKMLVGE